MAWLWLTNEEMGFEEDEGEGDVPLRGEEDADHP